ncbi:hypothetical protein C7437_102117 [Psychrobacillus insolitus]|uniref:Uncharacterized protein n=1 Tax=Psychrobacillus insolitus TaxID=1461 RepID=A0A2W7MIJ0_9BACI|nr:hypothetical protein C7437_102117 [Psychrobacillus insolitus]
MEYIKKGTKDFRKTNWALFAAGFITFANLYITQPILPEFSNDCRLDFHRLLSRDV